MKPDEKDIEEMKSVSNYIKYLSSSKVDDHEILNGIKRMEKIAKKMIEKNWEIEEIDGFFDILSMKKVMEKLFISLEDFMENKEE